MNIRECKIGDRVSFEGRRKKFTVLDHHQIYLEVLPAIVNGKNFIEHPGTRIRSSRGRTFIVKSDREVITH